MNENDFLNELSPVLLNLHKKIKKSTVFNESDLIKELCPVLLKLHKKIRD